MTPQFEAACIAAATLMAVELEYADPIEGAIVSWSDFRQSKYLLGEGMEGDEFATAEDAQSFADWWEGLSGDEQAAVIKGVLNNEYEVGVVADSGFEGTTYFVGGITVSVSVEHDMILEALIPDAEFCYDADE